MVACVRILSQGCIATLVDTVGSSALAALSPYSHASLSITANYLRPVPAGRRIRCAGAVTELGRTVATMSVSLYDTGDDALLAQGTRIKFIQRDFDLVSAMSKGGWATRGAPGNVIKSKP